MTREPARMGGRLIPPYSLPRRARHRQPSTLPPTSALVPATRRRRVLRASGERRAASGERRAASGKRQAAQLRRDGVRHSLGAIESGPPRRLRAARLGVIRSLTGDDGDRSERRPTPRAEPSSPVPCGQLAAVGSGSLSSATSHGSCARGAGGNTVCADGVGWQAQCTVRVYRLTANRDL